ncbi:MAG: SDR family oxidoreductase [Desulfobacterium sp.]|nr:SDR family oxidoreductase [Desulfobacterium sp.]
MSLKGKIILVTGATSGIGMALVQRLHRLGARPVLTGRNEEKVVRLAQQIGVSGYKLDVSREKECRAVVSQIEQEQGPIHGLVNNAGIWLEGDFEANRPQDIQKVINTNTLGTIWMSHAVLSHMLKRRAGAVVNVVSTGALYTRKGISVYSASKWAVRGFTGCLEVECAPKGVRVMGFYPGKVATNMYEIAGIDRDLEVAMTPEAASEMIQIMLGSENLVWGQVCGRNIKDYI